MTLGDCIALDGFDVAKFHLMQLVVGGFISHQLHHLLGFAAPEDGKKSIFVVMGAHVTISRVVKPFQIVLVVVLVTDPLTN